MLRLPRPPGPTPPRRGALGSPPGGEDAVDVLGDVVEVERDAQVRVACRDDDAVGGQRSDEGVRIGREDTGHRAVLLLPARGHDRRTELVEAGEQAVDERADVSLDARDPDLGDELHPGDARVERGNGRRTAVEASRRRVRRVVGDGHGEDVLVREPAGLRRQKLGAERVAQPHEGEAGRAQEVLHGSARDDVRAERADVEVDRADRLIAVGEVERSLRVRELGDRRHVMPVPGAEGDECRADEGCALVDRLGEALEWDAAVGIGRDVDDLGAS